MGGGRHTGQTDPHGCTHAQTSPRQPGGRECMQSHAHANMYARTHLHAYMGTQIHTYTCTYLHTCTRYGCSQYLIGVEFSGTTKKQLLLVQPTSNGRFTVIPQEQPGEGDTTFFYPVDK